MPVARPIDAKQLAEMFARAAEIKVAREGRARRSGRELLEAIFARARELQLAPPDRGGERPAPPPAAAPRPDGEVARGWNERTDGRAVDPDDLVATRFLERDSAIEALRSSLEELFSAGSDELPLPADSTEEPLAARPGAARPALFTQAAEALFGGALEELEQLVLDAWERLVRGERPQPVAPAAPSPTAPLVDVDDLLSGFAFEGGNPIPAAELARRAREQGRAPAAAVEAGTPSTLAWGAPPGGRRPAADPDDPFARPAAGARPRPESVTVPDPPALPPRPPLPPVDLLAGSTVHDDGGPIPLPISGQGTVHEDVAPIPLPPVAARPDATVHEECAPIPLPASPPRRDAFAAHDAFAPPPAGWAAPRVASTPPLVPAGWPFVDDPPPPPPPPPARRDPAPGAHRRPAPVPPSKPAGPPSVDGFDPFAPSWWDERPSDDDVSL